MAQSINLFRIGDTVKRSTASMAKIANVSKKEQLASYTGKVLGVRKLFAPISPNEPKPSNDVRPIRFVYYVDWNRPISGLYRNTKNWENEDSLDKVSLA